MARQKAVLLRFSADEYEELKAKAGNNVFAKWCRAELLNAPLPYKPNIVVKAVDPELLRELNRISVNINQIAKFVNAAEKKGVGLSQNDVVRLLLTFENINAFISEVQNVD